jgi:acyl-CoA thioesterase-1
MLAVAYGARRLLRNLVAMILVAVPVQATAEPVTILALGDSLTQGYGLAEADGFVPQLQGWLAANGVEAVVVNGGVSGDTTAGGAARIAWSLTPDIDAVIVALGGNDLLRGIDPAASRASLDAILAEVTGRGLPALLAGLPAPGNFGPDYKTAFDAIYPDLAAQYDALLYPNFMAGLDTGGSIADLAGLMQADGLHPNRDGVARIVADIGPLVADLAVRAAAN